MWTTYKKLFAYIPNARSLTISTILLSLCSCIFFIISFFYIYIFLESFLIYKEYTDAVNNALLILLFLILAGFFYGLSGLLSHILGYRLEKNLRKRGIEGLSLSSFRFYDKNSSGKTRKIIDDNTAETHQIIAHLIPDLPGAILTPILIICLAFYVDYRVGVTMLAITIVALITLNYMTGNQEFMKKYQESLENLSSEAVEYVRGIQVVKIFKATSTSFKSLHDAIFSYARDVLKYSMSYKVAYSAFLVLFNSIALIIIPVALLLKDSVQAEILVIDIIMIIFLAGLFFMSFMRIMYVSMYTFKGKAAVEKLEDIYNEMQREKLIFGEKKDFSNYDIEFKNVNFGYGENLIIEDLSFKLEAKKQYALVGSSGSGKSTIAKLISGFYKLNSGSIEIGGVDITHYREEAILKNIAFVFQDSKLFKDSIFENVRIARPNASYEEIMQALELAGCRNILNKFATREKTVIGSKGVHLSGGEKQRINIARAILKNANIIILDEASAAIDSDTEHELQKAFANLISGKTVIMIAHRLSTIRNVDEILVVENGKIIERDSHSNLMSSNSKYKYFQDLYSKSNDWRVSYD